MQRPKFEHIKSGAEFNRWYWLKEELVEICKRANLPATGRKFDLRDRIMYALDNHGKVKPQPKKKKASSKFNWAKADLQLDTVITDNVSFGPNFRKFMTSEIGPSFSCNSDFMAWVKANTGKTLADAVAQWHTLEKRKENPEFRRDIAANNMYNQYTRDFLDDNPNKTIKDAKSYWLLKKQLPTADGFIRYESSDLKLGKV
ncbi:DUF6434 domain-containing protein [Maribacter sp. 2308TA10-17]|uniref:DUF6434 domain-containing protein n=1 Tax=Maribacter sp. 2308TA10-17 TaxID=3386276 RepID=UPI0039BD89FD